MPTEIRRVTEQFLHNPVKVEVSRPASTASAITQQLIKCGRDAADKREVLRRLIRSAEGLKNGIVFCNRKSDVATVYRSLKRHGFSVQELHGDMSQPERSAALDAFRKNEVTLLVASDVAARGLDIPDVSHIYNFDVPHHPDDYVHRIGRTGRAGRSGVAITIVSPADVKSMAAVEKLIGQSIPWMEGSPGDVRSEQQADTDAEATPSETREKRTRSGRGRQRNGNGNGAGRTRADAPAVAAGQQPSHNGAPRAAAPRSGAPRAKNSRDNSPRPNSPRPARRQEADLEPDVSHLPAFLLRPVSIKA